MSDGTGGGSPWWEFDPDEKPVPLGAEAEWGLADEAELIVNSERDAIGREDTDPTLQTLATAREPVANEGIAYGPDDRMVSRRVTVGVLFLLLVGCMAMFSLGWSQGASARGLQERSALISPRHACRDVQTRARSATVVSSLVPQTGGLPVDELEEP